MDNMYKEASRKQVRFQTTRGPLSVEQLWGVPTAELDVLVVSLDEAYNNSKGKSFLSERTTKDEGLKLQFDIAHDILIIKAAEEKAIKEAAKKKEHNQKIHALIAEKKEGALKDMSVEELEELLQE